MKVNQARFRSRLARRVAVVLPLVVLSAMLAGSAQAAPAPWAYSNGFENPSDIATGSADNDGMQGSVTRVASGTGGIAASTGGWYGQADTGSGAFTRYGGYSTTFPSGGYTTSIDIYLPATPGVDQRFDWSSAISTPGGSHRRDFVFNGASTGTGSWVIAGSTNAGRSGANPNVAIDRETVSGGSWYTLKHHFRDNGFGVLTVDMTLSQGATAYHTWTRSDSTDLIGVTVGGNRYGWLVANELPLALDNVTRSGVLYGLSGFFQPIDNNNVNLAKAGQNIPAKWRLVDSNGNPVSDSSSFVSLTSRQVNCGSFDDPGTDAIETYTSSTGLLYQGDGYWQFNWSTPKSYAGQCRVMTVTLADGQTISADFQFKK
jgi:hypothetical protein